MVFIFKFTGRWLKVIFFGGGIGLPLLGSALTVQKFEQRPKNIRVIKSLVSRISKSDIKKELKSFLKHSAPGRMVGTLGHKHSYEYIISKLHEYDIFDKAFIYTQPFSPDIEQIKAFYQKDFNEQIVQNLSPKDPAYKRWKVFTDSVLKSIDDLKQVKGKNIIWEKKGIENPRDFILLGVHYDTIAFDKKTMKVRLDNHTPGADDNGSGVVFALELARLLSRLELKRSVRIIFFDFQELGFVGSRAYVKKYAKHPNEKWKGYINVEMIGHDSTILDKLKKSGNMKLYIRKKGNKGYKLDQKFANYLQTFSKQTTSSVNFKLVPNGFNMSDQINFWPLGIPSVAYTQDWENDLNPRHHTQDDFYETLNYGTYYSAYKYITAAVIAWAQELELSR